MRSWFEQLERDIVHLLGCHWHDTFLGPIFVGVQTEKVALPLFLLLGGMLAIRHPRPALQATLTAAAAFGICSLLAHVMWPTINRRRPPDHYERYLVTPAELATCASDPEALSLHVGASRSPSFPSRHGMAVGCLATAMLLASRWAGALAWLYGLLVAVGRVSIGKHWPTDVLAGLVIGTFVAWIVWRHMPYAAHRLGLLHLIRAPRTPDSTGDGPVPDRAR